ncbi:helix-turn-helix domain-containing protein [Chryseobacterium sp. Leaf405]|uniref:helix-turn-helix domain-containing protein n=1 Tax=Chryseobacterium sp. Leaf405 TaxID=1736367 RepID=UPI0039647BD6
MQIVEENQIPYVRVKSELPDELVENLTLKVQNFEDKKQFLEAGMTAAKLAARFKTNPTYLSTFIHERKGLNFSTYITQLRIEYITQQLNSDKDYLKYTIQALAEMCGIASRNNFTDHFKRINGIGVGDFIKMKLKDNEREQ